MLVKSFSNVQSIEIESTANVSIITGSEFQVKVSGDDADKVKVTQSDSTIKISYLDETGSINFSGGNIVIGNISNVSIGSIRGNNGKNISIINGEVFINGKKVEEPDSPNTPTKKPVEIEIQCSNRISINCVLSGNAKLVAFPEFDKTRITLQGNCSAKLQAKSSKFKISGCGEVDYKSLGGNLNANISGSGEIKASGSFNDIDASISGSGELYTEGTVKGDYDVSVSGTGEVNHSGTILGQKSKSISGCGSVYW